MPAVQPARLKIQIASLIDQSGVPSEFITSMHDLLSLYANRTHRSGETGRIRHLTPSYDPPIPVLRLLQTELRSLVVNEPKTILSLSDALWQENWWEFRILAAHLLGQVRLDSNSIVFDRLNAWLGENLEENLAYEISQLATQEIRTENPEQFLDWIQEALNRTAVRSKKIALHLMTALSKQPNFENLPAIFSLVSPYLRSCPLEIRPDMLLLLVSLIERSPNEIAFLFRQSLESSDTSETGWFIRKTLAQFPPALRASLQPNRI